MMLSRRLISILSRGAKQSGVKAGASATSATTTLNKTDIAKAIDLLSNKSTVISPSERSKYINQFASVLNHDFTKAQIDPLATSSSHFEQSLDGLSNLINNITNDVTSLDSISLRHKINSIKSETELLNVFDSLIHSGNLSLSSFKLIIMNNNCFNLKHFLNKFEFLDPNDKEFINYKILIVIKASVLNDKNLALNIYNQNIKSWIDNFEKNRLDNSMVLIKSFFQIIYKVDRDLKLLQNLNNIDNESLILLTEALPRQVNHYIDQILDTNEIELSKNQDDFIQLLSILTNHSSVPQVSAIIKKLVKSSVVNKLHLEVKKNDAELTMLQYRFHNELIALTDETLEFVRDSKLDAFAQDLKVTETEEVFTGALLKFI